MPTFPSQTLSIDEVQVMMLSLLMIGFVWIATAVIKHGNRLTRIETLLTNHTKHRFEKIAKKLKINYGDEKEWPE